MANRVASMIVLASVLASCLALGADRAAAAPKSCSRGDAGPHVRELQTSLKTLGLLSGAVDGVFGPATERAVRSFQARAKVTADGVAGPVTLAAIQGELRALARRREEQKRLDEKRASLERLRKQVLEARKTLGQAGGAAGAIVEGEPGRQPGSRGVIYLTMDDGPDPATTPWVLDFLKSKRVRATFFVVGEKAERNEALVRRMAAEGHSVQNHSHTHAEAEMAGSAAAEDGMARCARVIERLTGSKSKYYRPPGGRTPAELLAAASRQGHTVALWSNLWGDDARSAVAAAFDGAVLMVREQPGVIESSLPAIVERLAADGYRFSTLGP
ncbi:MAG: polysaccharide deacetylase family protein [Firmicutes bacterium]|nr:polysaccharide deacetylase family protein [Bacillota bacterium]